MKNKIFTTFVLFLVTLGMTAQVTNSWNSSRALPRAATYTHWGDLMTQRKTVEYVAVAEDSCIYVAGHDTLGFDFADATLNAIAGGSAYVLKYNSDGSEAWSASVYGAAYASHIVATDDQGVLVAGRFTGEIDVEDADGNATTLTQEDITDAHPFAFIAKYTDAGALSWAKAYAFDSLTSDDLPTFDIADLKVKGNKILIAGTTVGSYVLGTDTFATTQFDAWGLMLANPSSFAMVLSNEGQVEQCHMIQAEGDSQNFADGVAIDADSEGNITVASVVKGSYIINNDTLSTAVDLSGWAPAYAQALVLTNYDKDGTLTSSKTFANDIIVGSYFQNDIAISEMNYNTNDDYYIAGKFVGTFKLGTRDSLSVDTTNLSAYDAFVLKLNAEDSLLAYTALGSDAADVAPAMALSADSIYLLADYTGDLMSNEAETSNIYLATLNLDAELVNIYTATSDSSAYAYGIATSSNNIVAFTAAYQDSISVVDGGIKASDDNYQSLLAVVDFSDKSTAAALFDHRASAKLSVYPNPATAYITADACDAMTIYSISGAQVMHINHPARVDISSLKHGIYLVELSKGNASSMVKLIKR